MKLRALHTSGILDISSQEALQVYNESEPFRLALKPGQVVEVEDHWRKLKNIDNAITCGLLEVVEYDFTRLGEEVTHAELEQRLEGITAGGGFNADLEVELSSYPLESPGGGTRTFTLPYSHRYESGTVRLILNGQTLPQSDIEENSGNTTVTLKAGIPTPKTGDVVVLTYVRTVYPVATGEIPVETPDGSNRTFTLVDGDTFSDGKISILVNGIFISPALVTAATDGTGITLDPSVPAPQPNDIVRLMFVRPEDYPMEINVFSVEQPDGATRTFTLPNGDSYLTGDVELLVNGQRLPENDFIENAGLTSVTLVPAVPTPSTGDFTTFIYVKPS